MASLDTTRRARRSVGILGTAVAFATAVTIILLGLGLLLAASGAAVAFAVAATATLGRGAVVGALPLRPRGRRKQHAALTRMTAFISLNVFRRLLRPEYLFVGYAETDRDKRAYYPVWIERLLRPVYPSGLLHFGRFWGMLVAGKVTAQAFESSPEALRELLERTREEYPNVAVIALGGRIPSIAVKAGVPLEAPFVRGDHGTLYAMLAAAREQARLLGRPPAEVAIAVPGGGGFIGRRLVPLLAREFRIVIAIDPRFAGCRGWQGNILRTERPLDISAAEAVLVLTARGEDAAALVPFLAPGVVLADDTHPEIPAQTRARMAEGGVTVVKATVGDPRFRLLPRAPWFRADDIPGCLLEALVVLDRGRGVLETQDAFNAAASEMGFAARLAPHRVRTARR